MRNGDGRKISGKDTMVEVMVRFENLRKAVGAQESTVSGSVVTLGHPERSPLHFDGWLQLLSILENLSSPANEPAEPPLIDGPDQRGFRYGG